MKVLGVVCARGGSKGIKNKNIRELNGIPLIAYTINILKKWGKASQIICSTDSPEIAKIANEYGAEVPFVRPAELSTDTAPKMPVLQHALRYCEDNDGIRYDTIIDLQPTSPLRKVLDLDGALDEFLKSKADVLYSVYESKVNPYFTLVELDAKGNAHLSKKLEGAVNRRQDAPKVYAMNGSIYIYKRDFMLQARELHCENERIYVMDEISSIDIDSELDFMIAECLIKSQIFRFDFD